MKKSEYFLVAISAVLIIVLAGCAHTHSSKSFNGQLTEVTDDKPVAHIHADIFGYYLFNKYPIVVGNPYSKWGFSLFTDTVTTEDCVYMLTQRAEEMNADKVTNIKTNIENTGAVGYCFWIFWYKDVQASGNAVK